MQQEQENITKTNESQIKSKEKTKQKTKLKPKWTSKNKEIKSTFEEKENNVGEQELTCLVYRESWLKIQNRLRYL